jgi:hypothetical protein
MRGGCGAYGACANRAYRHINLTINSLVGILTGRLMTNDNGRPNIIAVTHPIGVEDGGPLATLERPGLLRRRSSRMMLFRRGVASHLVMRGSRINLDAKLGVARQVIHPGLFKQFTHLPAGRVGRCGMGGLDLTPSLAAGATRRRGGGACRRRSCACVGGSPNRTHTSTVRGPARVAGIWYSSACGSGCTAGDRSRHQEIPK